MQFRELVSCDPLKKRLAARQQQVARVKARQPQTNTGRQVYVKELNATAGSMRIEGKRVPDGMHKQILTKHGARW